MAIPQASHTAIKFIAKMIQWDPDYRPNPEQALNDEFITGHSPVKQAPTLLMN
jgi:hypothetical protein